MRELTFQIIYDIICTKKRRRERDDSMRERKTIGFLFKQINTVYEKEFNNRLRNLGITSSQCEVLDFLFCCGKEEVTQRDIEKALNLKNPTVTGLLKRLDEKGFILVVPSERDKRCKNVYLTEKAYDIRKRMEMDRKKIDKMLTLGMTKKEVETLDRLLNKVLYHIAEP